MNALLGYVNTGDGFSGRSMELSGAISQGETLEELKVNITDPIQLMLASIYEEAHEKKKMEIEVSELYDYKSQFG